MTIPNYPTFPTPPGQAPSTIGTNPKSGDEVNALLGAHLRNFLTIRATIKQDADFCSATDFKAAPYYFNDNQEATLKSAINDLNVGLQALDMTSVNRVVGPA